MGVAESLTRGRTVLLERPGLAFAALAGFGLLADLILRLAFGLLPVSQLSGFVLQGVILGLLYGLAGIGLSMTYSILNFANFSHGDLVTTGGFTGWVVAWLIVGGLAGEPLSQLFLLGTGDIAPTELTITVLSGVVPFLAILLGLLVAAGATAAISLGLDRLVYKPMRDAEGISLLIASVGVALALRYIIVFVWDRSTRRVIATDVPTLELFIVDGTIRLDAHEVSLIVASIGLMFGVHFLLQRTKLGTAMRAMADNEDLARVSGIPTERVVTYTWLIGGGLAGAAGFLRVLFSGSLAWNFGWLLLLLIFAAVILGGIGSIYGAIVGGLIVGLASQLALIWLPSEFARAAAFAVMILVLLFRPSGLFGGVTTA